MKKKDKLQNNNNSENSKLMSSINNNKSNAHCNNSKSYINSEFYPLVRNFKNINPNNLEIINIIEDGNYMFRSISHYINRNQENYHIIRKEIYETTLLKNH